ncbi:MAG: hypothetical protein JST31_02530 [Actinobacteria bacterium]|nr:hypothetical protein [Actinomycetota bacterium]
MTGVLGALVALTALAPARAAVPSFEPVSYALRLAGTNGYTITIAAAAEAAGGRGAVTVSVRRPGAFAYYTADGTVTTTSIRADFGSLGRIDAIVKPSGRTERVKVHACGPYTETFEPGVVEGSIDFQGEGGFTAVAASRAPLVPEASFFGDRPFGACSGNSELFSPGLPGARLKGVSYAGGRILLFQFNKNRPRARTLFRATLKERRGGLSIFREVRGVAAPGAFRFGRRLRKVTLAPPAPFAGTASTRRSPDAVSPLWSGDLTVDFPGNFGFPIAGPAVHVSLEHARRTPGDSSAVFH